MKGWFMPQSLLTGFSRTCLALGLMSIVASIAIWFFLSTEDPAHAERFGIFVGLWAPTFLILPLTVRQALISASRP